MNGLTSRGKRVVESAAFMLEERYGKKNLTFGTVTLPTVTAKESWWVSSNWNQVVRVFFQRLMRSQSRKGLPRHYVSVTELQPQRSEREKHPSLHLHFVFPGKSRKGGWGHSPVEIREMWKSALSPYLDGDRDWSAVENLQQVRRTTEGYLSKYLSKGCDGLVSSGEYMCGYELPKSWYSVSRVLLRAIVAHTLTSEETLKGIYEAIHAYDYQKRFEFLGEVTIPWQDRDLPVAIYGMIERSEWRDWREIRRLTRLKAKTI